MVEWVAIKLCIQEASGSNSSLEIGYPGRGFCIFLDNTLAQAINTSYHILSFQLITNHYLNYRKHCYTNNKYIERQGSKMGGDASSFTSLPVSQFFTVLNTDRHHTVCALHF